MTWYKQLRFTSNPLDIRPNPDLVGLKDEEERLLNHIKKGEVCFLNGYTGTGKSSMLARVQKKLKNHQFIYLNAEDLPQGFSLDQKLSKLRNFFDRITLRKYPRKQPVLLIDEFQATDPNLVLEAKGKWEKTHTGIKAIVIAQISQELSNASGSFKERIGNRVIQLRPLLHDDLVKILRQRLYNPKTKKNYFDKLDEEAVKLLIRQSEANPRRLLEYTDLLFDFHFNKFKDINPVLRSEYKISYYAARDILADRDIIDAIKKGTFNAAKDSYTTMEHKVLSCIKRHDVATAADIAGTLKTSRRKVSGLMSSLKQKGAIKTAGKRNNMQQWVLSPGMKRVLVNV